jgi:hypothetical protein
VPHKCMGNASWETQDDEQHSGYSIIYPSTPAHHPSSTTAPAVHLTNGPHLAASLAAKSHQQGPYVSLIYVCVCSSSRLSWSKKKKLPILSKKKVGQLKPSICHKNPSLIEKELLVKVAPFYHHILLVPTVSLFSLKNAASFIFPSRLLLRQGRC